MDVSRFIYCIEGVVIDSNDQRYSSTEVMGDIDGMPHGRVSGHIFSKVKHHNHQTIWLKMESGKEQPVKLYNQDVDVRVGHSVRVLGNSFSGSLERFMNKTTGRVWCVGAMYPEDGRVFRSLFYSVFANIPIWSLLLSIFPWFQAKPPVRIKGYFFWRCMFFVTALLLAGSIVGVFSDTARKQMPETSFPVSANIQAAFLAPIDFVFRRGVIHFMKTDIEKELGRPITSAELAVPAEMSRIEYVKEVYFLRDSQWLIGGANRLSYQILTCLLFFLGVVTLWVFQVKTNRLLSCYERELANRSKRIAG